MNYTYLAFLVLLVYVTVILKYKKDISKLKKENSVLKNQLEKQKFNNLNQYIATTTQKQTEVDTRKSKILEFLTNHETITNDQVESMLKISNSTAYRILEDLEQEGRISQIGKTGKDVYYIKNKFYKRN
jgi:predicted HTH transcriptional regulator